MTGGTNWPAPLDTDRLRRQLDAAADGLEVGDRGAELHRVRLTANRRTRRRNGAYGVAAVAVLLVGGGVAIGVRDDGGSDPLADELSSDATSDVVSSAVDRPTDDSTDAPTAELEATPSIETSDDPGPAAGEVAEAPPGAATGPVDSELMIDAGPQSAPPAAESALPSPDAATDSGLADNRLLLAWDGGQLRLDLASVDRAAASADRTVMAEISADDATWRPVELVVPSGVRIDELASSGDRLAGLRVEVDGSGSVASVEVLSTRDLTSWQSVTVSLFDDAETSSVTDLRTFPDGWSIEMVVRRVRADGVVSELAEVWEVSARWGESPVFDRVGN